MLNVFCLFKYLSRSTATYSGKSHSFFTGQMRPRLGPSGFVFDILTA